jgi:FKBP-type peptidyl-prolyl cis-trans isomerase 2
MSDEYKLSKQIIEEQGFEATEGNTVQINIEGEKVEAKIIKIEGDQVTLETV